MIEGPTTLAASFTGTVMGVQENINKVYTDIKSGQHRIITFLLKRKIFSSLIHLPDGLTPNEGTHVDTNVE